MAFNPRNLVLVPVLFGLTACAQQEEPGPIGVSPTFDKYGNAYCPEGFVLSGDVCLPVEHANATAVAGAGGGGGAPSGPGAPAPGAPGQNQNQNNNQNQNQNNNSNQNSNQSQQGQGG